MMIRGPRRLTVVLPVSGLQDKPANPCDQPESVVHPYSVRLLPYSPAANFLPVSQFNIPQSTPQQAAQSHIRPFPNSHLPVDLQQARRLGLVPPNYLSKVRSVRFRFLATACRDSVAPEPYLGK